MLSIRRIYTIIAAMLTLCATTMAQTTFSGPVRYVTTSGNYANDGTSWAQAKNNLQDAIESLHDYMTRNGITEGRVYVAAGTYRPTTSTPGGDGVLYTSFLIYEGITVYGGFNAETPETTPEDRIVLDADGKTKRKISEATGLKWRMKNTTILSGNHSSSSTEPMKWNSAKNEYDESFTGNSYHVVWFATNTSTHSSGLNDKNRGVALAHTAGLDGFTIRDGNASNRTVPEQSDGSHAYHNSYGGGVYMVANSEVRNCIIRQNSSSLRGGGVYMDGGGLMEQCYVTQNQSGGVGVTDGYGGGVACDDGGIVRHCLIENNAARCGGGLSIAFSSQPANDNARYASFATGCVVNNNTSSAEAGGVFMKNGGLLNHLTITYNKCVGAGVVYNNRRYGRSGGLYVDGGGMVTNSVIWGNEVAANNNVQYATYRENASTPKVKLDFVALSKYNYVDWSGTVKRTNGVYSLNEENSNTSTPGYYPDFTDVPGSAGVIDNTTATGRWNPRASSYLRHQGMQLNDYPTSGNYDTNGNDIVAAHITEDIIGNQFAPRCVLGAFVANSFKGASASVASIEDNTTQIKTIFIDPTTDAVVSLANDATLGSSWENAFSNINDALDYVKTLNPTAESPVQILVKQGTTTTAGNSYLPHIRSSYIDLPSHVRLYGGFASSLTGTDISKRNPKAYPTRITANITGSDYAENGCHIITVRHGATDVIVDGFQLYFANAQTSSVLPTLALEGGAGIAVINSNDNLPMKNIKIRNCVVANCTASQGSALFLRNTPGAEMQVDVENCIFHNNAVTREQAATVEATGNNTTLTLNHCLIRGNVGYGVMATDHANIKVKNTALHANIKYGSNSGSSNLKITDLTATESDPDSKVVTFLTSTDGTIKVADGASSANNMMDLGVSSNTDIATSKFSYHSSNTSTYPKFVNPTSNIGVNKDGDVTMYGGDPNWMPMNMNPMVNAANESNLDFGFDFTTVTTRNYGGLSDIGAIENTSLPEFGKVIYVTENGAGKKDGSSWSNAIAGNTVYDVTKEANVAIVEEDGTEILTSNSKYNGGFKSTNIPYGEESGQSKPFWSSNGNTKDGTNSKIENKRYERYVSGLQYAVEKAAEENASLSKNERIQIWVAGGTYTDIKGFVIRDKVVVRGGFPNNGNPGETERIPLLSKSFKPADKYMELDRTKYETILQVSSQYLWNENNELNPFTFEKLPSFRKTVLYQPDVCLPTRCPKGRDLGAGNDDDSNTYRYTNPQKYPDYVEYEGAMWDGFTVQNGLILDIAANRDGGAGIRIFRGVTIQNFIVQNCWNRGSRSRGGGIYCDGSNSYVINTYVIHNNATGNNKDTYGGGMYMIVGTSYNSAFVNNWAQDRGGGIFLENAIFYNNTVAHNYKDGMYQWSNSGGGNNLEMYNCLFYGNENRAIDSSAKQTLQDFHNCYIQTASGLDGEVLKHITGSSLNNHYGVNTALANPFSAGGSYATDGSINLRLLGSSKCVNGGWNNPVNSKNETIDLPNTDADFTDRIQDCTVDIGAYEFNGAYSISPDETTSADKAVFYVTQNGRGTGSAANPENAACWTKLQKVLDAAGRYLQDNPSTTRKVIVKLAGDAPDKVSYQYSGFVYRPRRSNKVTASGQEVNTRDYSIIVPHGVEVWGGYSDAFTSADDNGFYTKVSEGNYTDNRDVLKNRTTLSGVYQADDQDVNVYNVVTFTNDTYKEEGTLKTTDALKNIQARAVLDGLFIEGGNADGEKQSTGQRTDTRVGGAAIVTGYAHIRNCVVQNNKATDAGGGLYLEEGALVSGSIVQYNEVTKGDGGGLYVEEPASASSENVNAATNPARIFTSDIIYNTASGAGGGISFTTDGTPNVRANSVLFWQNTGSEQSNVNGMTTPTDAGNTNLTIKDYPISFCATETTREPGINNISVNTDVDKGVRFATETYNHDYIDSEGKAVKRMHNSYEFYKIKKYSLLARGGMEYKDYKALVESDALTAEDMANVTRTFQGNDFIDIGARAIGELVLPVANEDNLMTRIFVVKNEEDVATTSVEVMQNQPNTYYQQEGSSFAYPMRYLDDALQYVREARKIKKLIDAQSDSVYAYKNQKFEIILSGGTYYPMRNIKGEYVNSRGRTYLVPEGVTIVGGVEVKQTSTSDGESYYGNLASVGNLPESNATTTTFTYGTSNVVISHPDIKDIIKNRKLSDINHNNIAEPWEMAVQTILSGQVVNGNSNENVYHVIACIADEKHVGGLPDATITYHDRNSEKYDSNAGNGKVPYERGVPVIIDGVEIEDGTAMGYDAKAVNSVYTYYKGGAICVEGNWVTNTTTNSGDYFKTYTGIDRPVGYRSIPLEVRNCNFRNNGGNLGGAIFTDSELKVFACNFVQNYAEAKREKVDEKNKFYSGSGGAVNASYNTIIVNSLFANNQADTNFPDDGASADVGAGGAIIVGDNGSLHVINCDIVKNLAYAYPAIYCYKSNKGGKNSDGEQTLKTNNPHKIVNTIFWGNEVTGESGLNKVANLSQDKYDKNKNAEMLWFCAYEEGKGNAPVNSKNKIDYRLQTYTGFGTFIPSLWTGKYNYLDKDTTIIKSTVDNPDTDSDGTGLNPVTCNIIIASDNDAINGPNFINPSSKAGKAGYYTSADWMIGRINNLVDNGWTYLQQDLSGKDPTFVYEEEKAKGAGIYRQTVYDYENVNTGETAVPIGNDEYMTYADGTDKVMLRISTDPNPTHHQTYIDLGVYEYQHVKLDPSLENGHVDVLWVTQQERTSASVADGKTWETATSDVQRAIETLLASRNGHDKEIRMLEGQYQPVYTINGNLGFTITTDISTGVVPPDDPTPKGVNSLTIRGGYSKDVQGLENIHDYPVYLFASERSGVNEDLLGHIFVIDDVRQRESSGSTSGNVTPVVQDYVVPVYLDGLTFCNIKSKPHTDIGGSSCSGGAAVFYKDQKKNQVNEDGSPVGKSYVTKIGTTVTSGDVDYTQYNISGSGDYALYKLTMNRCDFRVNGSTSAVPAVTIGEGGGEALIYNSVFHSNMGSPLIATDTKVVNCTFALNGGEIKFSDKQSKSEMHNSVLWRNNGYETTAEWTGLTATGSMSYNAISSLSPEYEVNENVTLSSDNNDVLNGPNFFDPALTAADSWAKASRDFRVNPSAKIIGKASPKKYVELVKDLTGRYPYTSDVAISNTNDVNDPYYADLVEKDFDLAANTRHYGSAGMERGAYECIATLSRVLYVNPERDLSSSDYNGFSWEKAYTKGNLQKAIDAAAVYSNVNNNEKSYVFVKGMATSTGETITMRDNVTLYGSLPSTTVINTGVKETTDENGNKSYEDAKIETYIKAMDADRDGMASSYSKHTIVNGVKSVEPLTYCLFDGLEIGSGDNNSANVATSPVVDIQKGNVALRNSIIANNEITATGQPLVNLQSGLLYNTLIRDNKVAETSDALVSLGANGYMLNCTVVGGGLTQGSTVSHAINNIMYKETDAAMPFAPYFRHSTTAYHGEIPAEDVSNRNLWYQLHERTTNIEGGENGDANDESKYDGKSHVSDNLKQYVDYTSDRDLLGNPRFLGLKVDNGCFETWSTGAMTKSGSVAPNVLFADTDADNYNGQNYPHEGSVVYLHPGGKLVCKNTTDDAGDVKHYFTDANPLRPGYLLAMEGGSLYGQGNSIALRYVAAERTIAGQYALLSMPFDMDYRRANGSPVTMPFVTTTTYDSYNNNITESPICPFDTPFDRYEYDGASRSDYQYSFAQNNSQLWQSLASENVRKANEGMLIDRGQNATSEKLRFTAYGATLADYPYSESADKDYVTLLQYDDRESNSGGSDFTSVYNMGWNLKGMPYLISNYPVYKKMDDGTYAMNVPHVVYTMKADGSYDMAKQSWASSDDNTLSPGVAFFTQTATLNPTENLHFAQLLFTSSPEPNPATTRSAVTISLSSADATGEEAYRSVGVPPAAGAVCLQPVDNTSDDNTSMVYTINRDGAKFMSMNPSIPDIAVCGAGGEMMSLSGAAPVEKEISLATRVGSTGRYIFSLDRSAGVSPATTEVWLKDYQTGIVTNLMEDDYTAEITVGEDPASPVLTTGRFSLTIGGVRPDIGERDENSARWTISINRCHVTVSGLSTDSDVLFYTTDGILRHRAPSFLGTCEAELTPGVYVVRAEGNSKVIGLVRRDK